MDRLTKRPLEGEEAFLSCEKCGKEAIQKCWDQMDCTQTAVDRLAVIEDILGNDYDLDRLRELVEADREGRCVPVVRCRECRHYKERRTQKYGNLICRCTRMGKYDMDYPVKPDDFCSYGERSTD